MKVADGRISRLRWWRGCVVNKAGDKNHRSLSNLVVSLKQNLGINLLARAIPSHPTRLETIDSRDEKSNKGQGTF